MGIDDNGFDPELASVFAAGAASSIVSVLLDIRDEPHSASDICTHAGIARGTFYLHADRLEDYGILEKVELGSASGYRLADTDVTQKLIELEDTLEKHRQEQATVENEA